MGWRTVVISNISKLDLKSNYLSIRQVNEVTRVLIDEIDTLLIETTAASLTAALLVELAQKKVNVVFCDALHNPFFYVHPLYGSHNSSLRIRQQIKWKKTQKDIVWKEIVTQKIHFQKEVLEYFGLNEYKMLDEYKSNVEIGDKTNREGHAAKVYFNALFGKEFSRRDDMVENACLNYGYSIILSLVSREIVITGCLTQIGIHHDNQFNPFNLSCDIMEPFRPLIDFVVYKNRWEEINSEVKKEIINILNHKVTIAGQKQYLSNAISMYCKNIIDFFEEKKERKMYHIDYELQDYENYSDV